MYKKRFRFITLRTRWGRLSKKFYRVIEHQVVDFKEKPGKVALGCALGLSVNFFPTLGLGFLFAFILATLFRSNQVTATAVSLLTGPLIPFKYALNLIIGGAIQSHSTGIESFSEFISSQYSLIFHLGNFRDQLFNFLDFFGSTFMLGAAINAAVFGTVFYILVDIILKRRLRQPPPI